MEIIPGLPDDIAKLCLLKVPFSSHSAMASVSQRWENIVHTHLFYEERKRLGLSEKVTLIDVWHDPFTKPDHCSPLQTLLPNPPLFPRLSRASSYFFSFQYKLFVVKFTYPTVLIIYDFSSGRWTLRRSPPERRENFCCSVDSVKGKIYIAGGMRSDIMEELRTAVVYDIEEEKWDYLPPMISSGFNCHSVFTDGKFYVATTHREEGGRITAYDPNTRKWRLVCACFFDTRLPSFAEFERIYEDLFGTSVRWDSLPMLLDSFYWSLPGRQSCVQMEL